MQDYQKWQVEFEEILNKDFTCFFPPTAKESYPPGICSDYAFKNPQGMVRENLFKWNCQNLSC